MLTYFHILSALVILPVDFAMSIIVFLRYVYGAAISQLSDRGVRRPQEALTKES